MYENLQEIQNYLTSSRYTCFDIIFHALCLLEKNAVPLRSIVYLNKKHALEVSKNMDHSLALGKNVRSLEGVPICVKDGFCVKNMRTSSCSLFLSNYYPYYTSTVVQRLIDNGAVVLSKTNMDEFAMGTNNNMSCFFPCFNPLKKKGNGSILSPGGSSGGSAVAVSSGSVPIALGTDTGGSVRIPAAYCGIIGFKPSYGSLSRYGIIEFASSLDTPGIFGRNIDDIKRVYSCAKGKDLRDMTTYSFLDKTHDSAKKNKKYKIALLNFSGCYGIEQGDQKYFDMCIDKLSKEHFLIESVQCDMTHESLLICYYIISCVEVFSNLSRYDGVRYGRSLLDENTYNDHISFAVANRTQFFGSEVKKRIYAGSCFSFEYSYFEKARLIQKRLCQFMKEKVFSKYDCVIMPTISGDPPEIDSLTSSKSTVALNKADVLTIVPSLCGLPAISIPFLNKDNFLPASIQIVCNKYEEDALFTYAQEFIEESNYEHNMSPWWRSR